MSSAAFTTVVKPSLRPRSPWGPELLSWDEYWEAVHFQRLPLPGCGLTGASWKERGPEPGMSRARPSEPPPPPSSEMGNPANGRAAQADAGTPACRGARWRQGQGAENAPRPARSACPCSHARGRWWVARAHHLLLLLSRP